MRLEIYCLIIGTFVKLDKSSKAQNISGNINEILLTKALIILTKALDIYKDRPYLVI